MPIGFYTLSPVILPHPAYPKATLRVVESAISEAWRIIRDRPEGDFKIDEADEDRITLELRNCLINTVLYGRVVAGFTPEVFHITRDSKFESFDGKHLDKMPDIYIHIKREFPASIPSIDGLFVECKPIDRDHPAGGTYCDKGIVRFVNGEYAWAATQGLMVGYASPNYTLPGKLTESLKTRTKALGVTGEVAACEDCQASGYCQHPHITEHTRAFIYPETKKKAPHITIRHIWFNKK